MFLKVKKYFLFLIPFVLYVACQTDSLEIRSPGWYDLNPKGTSFNILHIAHTRMDNDSFFNKAMAEIDYDAFDVKLLGGDMAYYTSRGRMTIDSLDKIFDLGNPNTLWSLGNHDYDDLAVVEEYTERPPFYTHTNNGITFLVIDTQDSMSNFVGEQLQMIKNVVDTISQSSHLIMVHHKLIWLYENKDLKNYIESISNGRLGELFRFINPNNFYSDIYPLLLEVEKKGIEVHCIAGDIGSYSKTFYYQTPEGIDFYASGLFLEDADNKVLIFKYNPLTTALDYEFVLLSDL